MHEETLISGGLNDDAPQFHDAQAPYEPSASESTAAAGLRPIAVAATFTADPLRDPLKFWCDRLTIAADIEFAPYAQVVQELLSAQSSFSRNRTGFNVLLIRLEDWIRDRKETGIEENIAHVRAAARQLAAAIEISRARNGASLLMMMCPSSSSLPSIVAEAFAQIERELIDQVASSKGVHCWTHADLVRLYPVLIYEDARADRIGHIPYKTEYFVAIATLLARRIAALIKPQYKVIAVDCDNTLWQGICGEDGAAGVRLTMAR